LDLQLAGKRVLITGGSAGIGRAAATLFAKEGATLAISGRRGAALGEVADAIAASGQPRPEIVVCDLDDPSACAQLAARVTSQLGGSIDILFNNAGASAPLADAWDESLWERSHQLNFAAARQITAGVVADMKAKRWGRIINVTGAMVAPTANAAAPAKAALQSWSRSLAIQLAPFNITVNTIAPGRISTDQINNKLHPTEASRQAFIDRFIPAGYFGEPEDLAVLAVFLASPMARYINGAAIPVDGAMYRIG
jgi:3-oxoacyl-[acyl-carrier protein] reductase